MRVYTPESMKKAEQYMFDHHMAEPLELMQKAAAGMFVRIKQRLKPFDSVVVLCGKGNNAGDGYELARLIMHAGYNVVCISVFEGTPATDIAFACFERFLNEGGTVEHDYKEALSKLAVASVVIDAVFGIGFRGVIEQDSAVYKLLDAANRTTAYRIALDVPSGVRSGDGSIGNMAFLADYTLTVTALKVGMMSYPARLFCGLSECVDIGVPDYLFEKEDNPGLVPDDTYIKEHLPKRPVISNKGDFGKLLCLCGSENMTGAAVLSVEAALRAGAGLVTLASEKAAVDCVRYRLSEPIYQPIDWNDEYSIKKTVTSLPKYRTILIGCGLDKSKAKADTLDYIVRNASAQLIIDADGINLLADHIDILREAKKIPIITPHPGEFSRISGKDVITVNDNRIQSALEFAQSYQCITVLKGAGTVTAAPDGRFGVNPSGNAGLAKGGSGDVLAGLIAGLAANPNVEAFQAAVCGVYLHGRAADVLKEKYSEYGLLPSQLSEEFAKMLP